MIRLRLLTTGALALGALTAAAPAPKAPAKPQPATKPAPKPAPGPDLKIMQVQVILDHLGFSPGVIDGKGGAGLKRAVAGFQKASGVVATGGIDPVTAAGLQKFAATQPVREITLTPADLAGDFVGAIPHKEDAQAKL